VAVASPDRPRLAIHALGCRVNQAEADALAAAVGDACELVAAGERADVVVVNTCTVTGDAARAARQAIRRAARDAPGARIVAAGCHAELCAGELATLPGVAVVVGARDGEGLAHVVRDVIATCVDEPAERSGAAPFPAGMVPPPEVELRRRARPILKVQDGCSARCSYCIVPRARGPGRSLRVADAVRRIRELAAGSAEVVLAGVHLGAYGRDLTPRASLGDLLDAAARDAGAHRLRLSSVEPHELPELRDRAQLCAHVHLPAQSGSDRILRAMRRPYRARDVVRAAERAAGAMPGACLGLDLIAGFPGETDEDHRATVGLVEALPVAYLHVFPFSPRPGTDAARLAAPPRELARARAAELRALGARRWTAFLDGLMGRDLEAVVERVEGGLARGTTREYAPVAGGGGGGRVTSREGERLAGVRAPADLV
jgi:threonylcarbamoyladenosine tRNA methylthiotransferase MtaB